MGLKNKVLGLILISSITLGIVGCNNQETRGKQNTVVKTDDSFIADFEKAINKRWDEQNKLEKKATNSMNYTEEQYVKDTTKILEEEINIMKTNLENVEDKDLKKLGNDYINGVKKQIEANKTNDIELMDKYLKESDKLRKPALISMVDDYKIKVKDAHQQTYKDFKEQATVINKENEAQVFADKLARETVFEKSTDGFGETVFSGIVENTSKIDYKSVSYKVQYKDADGIVIGDDYVILDNFSPGAKQKLEMMPYKDGANSVVVTTDWFETK